ncbi:MAG: right-handed parallel beta-helix repeat-containing protein [Planctomycetia bacterium]|nr:right-handed parallel beta-helix repeat-containing protein [Planctomycetia bacterium]
MDQLVGNHEIVDGYAGKWEVVVDHGTPDFLDPGDEVTWHGSSTPIPGLVWGDSAFETIQPAIANTSDGGTVSVAPGTYPEALTISRSLTLIGDGVDSTVVNPNKPFGYTLSVISPTADLTLQGMTVSNVGLGGISFVGDDLTIEAARVQGGTFGISLASGSLDVGHSWVRATSADPNHVGVFVNAGTTAVLHDNDLSTNVGQAVSNDDLSAVVDASGNWWGDGVDPATRVTGNIDYTPWLDSGDDSDDITANGFQGDRSSLTVSAAGEQTGGIGRIQEGVNLAAIGGTVNVEAGAYAERLNVNRSLTLLGARAGQDARGRTGAETVVTEVGLATPNPDVLIEVPLGVNGVTIDGFTLSGDPTNPTADTSAIRAWGNSLTVANNIISGRYGLIYKGGQTLTVDHNAFTVNKTGVAVQPLPAGNVTITSNRFLPGTSPASDAQAIYLTGVTGGDVSHNAATGFVGGALNGSNNRGVDAAHPLTIHENTFTNNKSGVSLWGGTCFVDISGNVIDGSAVAGISVKGQDIAITDNEITDSPAATGIVIEHHALDSLRIAVEDNTVNGVAVGIAANGAAGIVEVKLEDNDLTGNGVGLLVQGNALVDAGEGSLGSLGNNTLTGYTDGVVAGNYAIKNLNLTVAAGGTGVGVSARNNIFGAYVDPSVIENYLYDDTDDASRTAIDFGNAQGRVAAASTVYVDDDWAEVALGVDPDGVGVGLDVIMGVDAFATIADGVSAVAADGTVHVFSGDYFESNIAVAKPMTIDGESREDVVLYSDVADSNDDSSFNGAIVSYGFLLQASGVTIRDLTIDGDDPTTSPTVEHRFRGGIMTDHGIAVAVFDDVAVENVTVQHTYRRGIQINSPDGVGSDNSITNSAVDDVTLGPGIAVFDADVTITGSEVSNTVSGIEVIYYYAGAPLAIVQGNTLTNVEYGIQLAGPADGSIIGGPDELANNVTLVGTATDRYGILVRSARGDVTVENNSVTAGGDADGIVLFGNGDADHLAQITSNILINTSPAAGATGISMSDDGALFLDGNNNPVADDSDYATITGNVVAGFDVGIDLAQTGTKNVVATVEFNGISGAATAGLRIRGEGASADVDDNIFSDNSDKQFDGDGYALDLTAGILADNTFDRAVTVGTSADPADITVPAIFSTIQGGVDAATAGDTVNVAAGTYVE